MGFTSHLYAMTIDEDLRDVVRPVRPPGGARRRRHDLPLRPAVADDAAVREPAARPGPAVPQHHAGALLRAVRPNLFRLARLGRQDLATLVGRVDLALGDSEYNRAELEQMGFAPTGVMPIAIDTARITGAPPPRPALEEILDDGLDNFLFVGRIVPEQEDRGLRPAGRAVQALRERGLPLRVRRPLRRRPAVLCGRPRADGASTTSRRTGSSSPARCRTRTWRPTSGWRACTSR